MTKEEFETEYDDGYAKGRAEALAEVEKIIDKSGCEPNIKVNGKEDENLNNGIKGLIEMYKRYLKEKIKALKTRPEEKKE